MEMGSAMMSSKPTCEIKHEIKKSIVNKLFRLSDQPTSIKREEVPHLDLNYIPLQSNKVGFIYFFTIVLFLLNKKHINRTI